MMPHASVRFTTTGRATGTTTSRLRFIKSMRGGDADAAVYYLAAMLEAGEDARFLARRMVILASEDVGNADPQALVVAVAAAHAVEHVGLPEAQLNLAQAAIYLARAPKSNASAVAIWEARNDVRAARKRARRRPRCSDAHSVGEPDARGPGEDYVYPHDDPAGFEVDVPPGGAARTAGTIALRERRRGEEDHGVAIVDR